MICALKKYALPAVVTISGFLLRFYQLGERSLWGDEIMTVLISRLEWVDFWRMRIMVPVSYLLVRFSLLFGENELVVRLPSFFAGVTSVPVIYFLASSLFNCRVGLISSLMLSFSFFHIGQSQEARYYSLLTLFFLLSLYFLFQAIEMKRRLFWILWFLSLLGGILTITPGYLIAAGEVVFLLLIYRQSVHVWLASIGKNQKLALAGFWLVFFFFTAFVVFPSVEHRSLIEYLEEWSARDIPEKLRDLNWFFVYVFSYFWTDQWPTVSFVQIYPLFWAIFFLGLTLMIKARKEILVLLFNLIVFIPLLILWITKPSHDLAPKYFIYWLPVFFIAAAVFFDWLATNISRLFYFWRINVPPGLIIFGVWIVFYFSPSLQYLIGYYRRPLTHDLMGMAKIIKQEAKPGDLVIFNDNLDITPLGIPYYLDRLFGGQEYWQRYGYHIVSIPQRLWIKERVNYKSFPLYGLTISLCPDCVLKPVSHYNNTWFISLPSRSLTPDFYHARVKKMYTLKSDHIIYQLEVVKE